MKDKSHATARILSSLRLRAIALFKADAHKAIAARGPQMPGFVLVPALVMLLLAGLLSACKPQAPAVEMLPEEVSATMLTPLTALATSDSLLIEVACPGWKAGDVLPLALIEQTAPTQKSQAVSITPGQAVEVAQLSAGVYHIGLITPILADGTMFAPIQGYSLTIGDASGDKLSHSFALVALTDEQMGQSALDDTAKALGISAEHPAYQAAKGRIDAATAAGPSVEEGTTGNAGQQGTSTTPGSPGSGTTSGGAAGGAPSSGSTGGSSGGGTGAGGSGGGGGSGGVQPPPVEVWIETWHCSCGTVFGNESEVRTHWLYYPQAWLDGLISQEEANRHYRYWSEVHVEYH